jgi:hypothetical protein
MRGVRLESFEENLLRKGNDPGGIGSDDAVDVIEVIGVGGELLADCGDGLCGGSGAGAGGQSRRP